MVGREQNYRHSKSFMLKHPTIQPRMRSILLDWLIEVSEAYTLHRQTFYLAQDYFDRFMLTQNNIEKGMLQLIGITCLFIAAKMEEAFPPKLSQMAYMTAGTYYEEEIIQMEIIILKVQYKCHALHWHLCPETAVSWLKLYFQMASMNSESDLLQPQFPQEAYVQMALLLDLCILNINSLDFEYRVLAASVLSHFIGPETAEKVSGLSNDIIQLCVNWMAPFVESVGWFGRATLRNFVGIKREDRHNIQTHTDYLTMLVFLGVTCVMYLVGVDVRGNSFGEEVRAHSSGLEDAHGGLSLFDEAHSAVVVPLVLDGHAADLNHHIPQLLGCAPTLFRTWELFA
ncbi:hypothetical protein FQN60_007798, partial [Etheostoma spectabile]